MPRPVGRYINACAPGETFGAPRRERVMAQPTGAGASKNKGSLFSLSNPTARRAGSLPSTEPEQVNRHPPNLFMKR